MAPLRLRAPARRGVDHVEMMGKEWPIVIVRRWQEDALGQRVLMSERAFDLNNVP